MKRLANLRAKLAAWRRDHQERIACGPGCGGRCCVHSAIECSHAEALAVAEALPPEAWRAVLAADYRDPAPPCPLSIAGACSAYAVRPVYCRTWHVSAASDPMECGSPDTVDPVLVPVQLLHDVRRYLGAKPPGPTPRRWLTYRLQRIAHDLTNGARPVPPGLIAAREEKGMD